MLNAAHANERTGDGKLGIEEESMNRNEIIQSLKDSISNPSIKTILVRGAWGIGKTYLVREALKDLPEEEYTPIFTSMFGVKNSDQFQSQIAMEIADALLKEKTGLTHASKWLTAGLSIFEKIPAMSATIGNSISNALPSMMNHLVKDGLIIVDDVERKHPEFAVSELVGILNRLVETKNCRIVIIGNIDKLTDGDSKEFYTHIEKVIDQTILIQRDTRSLLECTDLVENPAIEKIVEMASKLSVDNIRTFQRLSSSLTLIHKNGIAFPDFIKEQCVLTLLLALHIRYNQPDNFPDLAALKEWEGYWSEKESFDKQRWNKYLTEINYTTTDELDRILIDMVDSGHLNQIQFDAALHDLQKQKAIHLAKEAVKNSWYKFHSSFKHSDKDICATFVETIKAHREYMTIGNFNDMVHLFKVELNASELAQAILDEIPTKLTMEQAEQDFWSGTDAYQKWEPEIQARIDKKYANQADIFGEIIPRITAHNGWHPSDVEALLSVSTEDLVAKLESSESKELRMIVNGYLLFKNASNADEKGQQLTQHLSEALSILAQKSAVNKLRVDNILR